MDGAAVAINDSHIAWKTDINKRFPSAPASHFNTVPALRGGNAISGPIKVCTQLLLKVYRDLQMLLLHAYSSQIQLRCAAAAFLQQPSSSAYLGTFYHMSEPVQDCKYRGCIRNKIFSLPLGGIPIRRDGLQTVPLSELRFIGRQSTLISAGCYQHLHLQVVTKRPLHKDLDILW